MRRAFRTTLLAVVVASGIPATAHHSNPPRIVGGGQIRFSNGDVLAIGGGPKF